MLLKLGVIVGTALLVLGCTSTNVEMNPYADGSRPTPPPTYGQGAQPNLGRIDRGIDSVPPYHR